VIDAVRAADWIPRSSRKRGRDIQRAFLSMEEELGRAPSDQEVAEALGLTLTQLHRAMADAVSTIVSLERPMRVADEDSSMTLMDCVSDTAAEPGTEVEQRELRQLILEALERLEERERLILSLYYEQSLTLREIGQVMEISESRVWQLHARAITRIRAYIDADPRALKKGA
jgi:RNA polymerase sigma factor for flagellar operon FliA